jgi:predicted nucleic acid-binding protein
VARLREALRSRESIVTTGLVLQELLQGFRGPKARDAIVERFAALPMIVPDRDDHVAAAELGNTCRRKGIQIGTIDALLIQLCCRHELTMLSTDQDYDHAAKHVPLKRWRPQ